MGTVFNIQKFCLHDGDGIRTNVFLKGCPLRCIWCHNPEGLERTPSLSFNESRCTGCGRCLPGCPAREIKDGKVTVDRSKCTLCGKCVKACLSGACEIIGKERDARDVMREVLKDKIFFDNSGGGLTVSGGEPSYQPEFTLELLRIAKDAGIGIAVETCGTGSRDFYEKAADLGVTFLYDLKCMDPVRHKKFTGADNGKILDNLEYLFSRGADVIARIPLIPGVNDTDGDIDALCRYLTDHDKKYRYAEIMPYHKLGVGKARKIGTAPAHESENATQEEIDRWVARFRQNGIDVRVSK